MSADLMAVGADFTASVDNTWPTKVMRKIEDDLRAAADDAVADAQSYAHVVSGKMRDETRVEKVAVEGHDIVAEWGGAAPYTANEIARGGAHDYLSPSWERFKARVKKVLSEYE